MNKTNAVTVLHPMDIKQLDEITEDINHLPLMEQVGIFLQRLDNYPILKAMSSNLHDAILLYFATKNQPDHANHIKIRQALTNEVDLITQLETNPTTNGAQYTYLKHKDSDLEFDLTYIDHFRDDINEPLTKVTSYLYGDPYQEDYTHRQVTLFEEIEDVIEEDTKLSASNNQVNTKNERNH